MINYTRTAAFELARHGIRVNAIAPTSQSPRAAGTLPGRLRPELPGGAVGRLGDVDDIAGAAVFLASGLARYVTGQTIHVDGGTQAAGGWYHDPDTGRDRFRPG